MPFSALPCLLILRDIILEVEGQPVDGIASFIEIVNSLESGQEVTRLAVDHRSGQSGYLQVVVRRSPLAKPPRSGNV